MGNGTRMLKPIRILSVALALLGLSMSLVLVAFIRATPDPPPIFKYALVTLPMTGWAAGFAVAGTLILVANIAERWVRLAHSFGAFIYAWWGLVLTVAAVNPKVVTSGYSLLCLIAALAHWVCASYWKAEHDAAV